MSLSERARFGLAIPQVFVEEPLDPGVIGRFVARAESLGYDSLWTQDQDLGRARTLEPLGLLCFVAAMTSRVRLGVSVLVLPHRGPVSLAKQLATLDQLSRGRLTVGVGLGRVGPDDCAFAIGDRERVARFNESVGMLKSLWTQRESNHAGRFWSLASASMEPKPVQRPHPPVWIGGGHPNSLRRAVEVADGWMGAGSSTIAQFEERSGAIGKLLRAEARPPGTFAISKRLYVAIDEDEARAERRLRQWFDAYYGNADLASRVCVWGAAGKVESAIHRIVDAGAQLVLLNPLFDQARHAETLAEIVGLGPDH